jgi:hypothetical protein
MWAMTTFVIRISLVFSSMMPNLTAGMKRSDMVILRDQGGGVEQGAVAGGAVMVGELLMEIIMRSLTSVRGVE